MITTIVSIIVLSTIGIASAMPTVVDTNSTAEAFNVLAFWATTGDEAHTSFYNEANRWFPQQASAHGFTYRSTSNWDELTAENLKKYQVLLFLDDVPYSDSQHRVLQHYLESGAGGLIAFHASMYNDADPGYTFQWFYNTLFGAGRYVSNTWWPTKAKLHVDSPNHPAMKGLPQKFDACVNEWYRWQHDLRQNKDIEILASIDPSSFPLGTDPSQTWHSGYYPVIWANKHHRAIYMNVGHNLMDYGKHQTKSSTFASEEQNKFLFQAMHWAAGRAVL
ncbi:uncharacterized protein LOC128963260 [Oppia nitens]|uniref:uncharacterized protein LOC128963260 n=1 Tax=Oppia nitens TaxID=1686743 RepID=UPI0023DBF035|nr:uncharacterized protein LOC128963260 [Oppia nitens]